MAGYIALFWGVFWFAGVLLLLGRPGALHDLVRRRVTAVTDRRAKPDILEEELSRPLSERLFRPAVRALSSGLHKYAGKTFSSEQAGKKPRHAKWKRLLRQAGLRMSVGEYFFLRLLVITGSATLFGLLSGFLRPGRGVLFGVLFGLYAGYAGMRFYLSARISKRRGAMERQLPDVLDLLSVSVEAGLGFEQALLHVIGHFEGPIIDELTVACREMSMGRPRREALALLADRCDLGEMRTFTASVIQAEQLGISLKNVLRAQAAAMRTSRRNKAEEKAMNVSVKILLPMVGLIFPVLLIILMGPAALKIISIFK